MSLFYNKGYFLTNTRKSCPHIIHTYMYGIDFNFKCYVLLLELRKFLWAFVFLWI